MRLRLCRVGAALGGEIHPPVLTMGIPAQMLAPADVGSQNQVLDRVVEVFAALAS